MDTVWAGPGTECTRRVLREATNCLAVHWFWGEVFVKVSPVC